MSISHLISVRCTRTTSNSIRQTRSGRPRVGPAPPQRSPGFVASRRRAMETPASPRHDGGARTRAANSPIAPRSTMQSSAPARTPWHDTEAPARTVHLGASVQAASRRRRVHVGSLVVGAHRAGHVAAGARPHPGSCPPSRPATSKRWEVMCGEESPKVSPVRRGEHPAHVSPNAAHVHPLFYSAYEISFTTHGEGRSCAKPRLAKTYRGLRKSATATGCDAVAGIRPPSYQWG
jgi:hypothetical protein